MIVRAGAVGVAGMAFLGWGLSPVPEPDPDGKWLLHTAEGDGGQYDVRAFRIEDGHDVAVVATPEDEREADWVAPSPEEALP